jgi:hypothetical protein
MSTYTFIGDPSDQEVEWNNTSVWSTGVVPNDPSADVVIPTIYEIQSGTIYHSYISIDTESFEIGSLSISNNTLSVEGASLTVTGAVSILTGALIQLEQSGTESLTAGSIDNDGDDIQGAGSIVVSGSFLNQSAVDGVNLTITAGSFDNAGELLASAGSLTILVAPGEFTNLSGSTLTGGEYVSDGGVLDINAGGVVTTDAAQITESGSDGIQFYNSSTSTYQPLEATLQTIAASGSLTVAGDGSSWGALTVDGLLQLEFGDLTTQQLTIDPSGTFIGIGTLSGPIVDDGVVTAGLPAAYLDSIMAALGLPDHTLDITGAIAGSGSLVFAPATFQDGADGSFAVPWTLELGGATSVDVAFATDGHGGTLILDDPYQFTGSVTPDGSGDAIQLTDISITGYSYAGDSAQGTLTLDVSGGSPIELNFVGDYSAGSFDFQSQQVLSSQPANLLITVNAQTPDTVTRDDFLGSQLGDFLVENTVSGFVAAGQVESGAATYTTLAALGPEWKFVGDGDFYGDGTSDFLIENSAGAVVTGEFENGAVTFQQVASLGPEWSFEGTGSFLDNAKADFLMENTAGVVVVGEVVNGAAAYTEIAALGPEWKFVGSGDFLGNGHDQFLMENTAGDVVVGNVSGGAAVYTEVAELGPEWKFVGAGDFLGDGKDDFLIENTSGIVVVGEVANGQAAYTEVATLGPEWSFVGAADYLGEGHDQFLIENSSGLLAIGDVVHGQAAYTMIGSLSSDWAFH